MPTPMRVSARLDLPDAVTAAGGSLAYRMVNDGDARLLFGAGYAVQTETATGWSYVPLRLAFAAWGAFLEPGETSRELPARLPVRLAPARYRLVVDVIVCRRDGSPHRGDDGQPVRHELFAGFIVG